MTAYERVTYRPEGERARTVILRDPRLGELLGVATLGGVEVDVEGDERAPRGVDERRHIIELSLVVARVPLRMNVTYGELEPAVVRGV